MKTFEDLSNVEKQKLSIYLQYINFIQITTIITLLFGTSIFLVGYALLFVFVIPVIIFTGCFLLFVGISFVLLAMLVMIRDKKGLFLIFGYKGTFSGVFDIKQEDIKKVKIIKETKWIKEK